MADELYQVLGVKKDASQADIRKAYRALAKKHHPDLNPGDKAAEDTFRKVQTAHDILADAEQRAQYDAGGIDADGKETARRYYREYADTGDGHAYSSNAGYEDFGDIFSDLFRTHGNAGNDGERMRVRMRGGDARYRLEITFLEAVHGAKRRVTMPDGKTLDVSIPAGHRDGQILRLRGKGMPGLGGGEAGDAYVEVHVAPHPTFHRRGRDILCDLAVALDEAVLGGKVTVPTAHGSVSMSIPPNSNTGDTLRLKGKGVPASGKHAAGDQLVTLRVMLPKQADETLKTFLKTWSKDHAYDPRAETGA